MGRQVRRVPPDWEHPRLPSGEYRPLRQGPYQADVQVWEASRSSAAARNFVREGGTLDDWSGEQPQREDYMPEWAEEQATYWQMYEDTTDGTPISPPLKSPESLARWLADSGASSFGQRTATYEQWLAMIQQGDAVGLVMDESGLRSGVERAHSAAVPCPMPTGPAAGPPPSAHDLFVSMVLTVLEPGRGPYTTDQVFQRVNRAITQGRLPPLPELNLPSERSPWSPENFLGPKDTFRTHLNQMAREGRLVKRRLEGFSSRWQLADGSPHEDMGVIGDILQRKHDLRPSDFVVFPDGAVYILPGKLLPPAKATHG